MTLPEPFYDDGQCVIYHGDCREILPSLTLDDVTTTITDPPYGETALVWDCWPIGWVGVLGSTVSVRASLWCFGSMRMFLEHRDEFAGWKFAQDIVWEKQAGSGFQADRFRRVHEHATHWYRGRWGEVFKNPQRESLNIPNKGRVQGVRKHPDGCSHLNPTGRGFWEDDGTRMVRSVLRVRSMHQKASHPTQKPLGIIVPLVEYSSPADGLVLDPFMGSGTTLRAAKDLGRRAIGIEIEREWCELAVRRLGQEVLPLGDIG